MPNLAEIHPVVWAPNPKKQATNKQTDRLLYICIDLQTHDNVSECAKVPIMQKRFFFHGNFFISFSV